MSQHTHQPQQSPYPREDYFSELGAPEDRPATPSASEYGSGDGPQHNPGPAGVFKLSRNHPPEILAHKLLRQSGDAVCGTTLHGPPDRGWTPHMAAEGIEHAPGHDPYAMHHENELVELSEPAVRPPTETANGQRYRKRINSNTGYISGGHSTSVVIADRPEAAFLAVVENWLDARSGTLRECYRQQALNRAKSLKRQGRKHDVAILEHVVRMVRERDFK